MSGTIDPQAALHLQKQDVEERLRVLLKQQKGIPRRLRRAIAHSLFGGGKRLRPALLLWTYDAFVQDRRRRLRVKRDTALTASCALEMIHTYSLIHDDLPAMDDDVLRRGRPTCHVAFDEATAILAGDGLHALAFEILGRLGEHSVFLTRLVAEAVGPCGMVGGQQEDLEAEGRQVTAALVRRIHDRKTARLIAAACGAGAWLAGTGAKMVERVGEAGRLVGLAFQGADDLLDATGSAASLGKTAGKDAAAGKATWVRVEGLEAARQRTERLGKQGVRRFQGLLPGGPASDRLLALLVLMWRRDR